MSEKRKIQRFNLDEGRIWEAIEGLSPFKTTYTLEEVCEKLNEQQATISKQLDQIIELQDKYRILEFNHSRLEKRNKAQYEKIGEQQATIKQLEKELASVCVEKSLVCDELEILKKVIDDE